MNSRLVMERTYRSLDTMVAPIGGAFDLTIIVSHSATFGLVVITVPHSASDGKKREKLGNVVSVVRFSSVKAASKQCKKDGNISRLKFLAARVEGTLVRDVSLIYLIGRLYMTAKEYAAVLYSISGASTKEKASVEEVKHDVAVI